MGLEQEHEVAVLQTGGNGAPRALVFSGPARALTPAQAKRARFVYNLKLSYARFKESLEAVEHFAVVCELSQERIEAIRRAKDQAMEELSAKFTEKLKAYDLRIGGGF